MTKPLSSYERALETARTVTTTGLGIWQQYPATVDCAQALLQAEEMLEDAESIILQFHPMPGYSEWLAKRKDMLGK